MSFGKRRPKYLRAILRPSNPIAIQHERQARQRNRWARLGVVAIAILATAALIHGGGPPFPYRLHQRPERQIRVSVDGFLRKDSTRTTYQRQKTADEVAPSMINKPERMQDLAARLDDLINAVAKAESLDSLPVTLRESWGLTSPIFDDLKTATDTPERREDLSRQITQAFQPILRDGVLGPDTLPPAESTSLSLSVRDLDQPENQAHNITRERAVPERISKPEGPVAAEFIAPFVSPRLGQVVFGLVGEKLARTPTLSFDPILTSRRREIARNSVKDVYEPFVKGDLMVDQDQELGQQELLLLRQEHDRATELQTVGARLRRLASVIVLAIALYALIGYYVGRNEPEIAVDFGRIAAICGLCCLTLGLVRLLALQPWDAELVPIAITAMVLAVAYNPQFALMVTFALCLMTTLALGADIGQFVVMMGGTAAGVLTLNEVRTRTKLIKVGATAALGYFLLTIATGLFQNQPLALVAEDSLWRAGWGLLSGFFLGGSLPFVETSFGIVTGISLLELGDVTHPLLQELVRRAPGTHNHSITVGAIAQSAAERIGANALLVRIGAYFHDIGKMLKPHYFVENQVGGTNRHANLAPAMSTLIIIGHVKDGVDLGRQHHLPEPIIDLIEQHHGTTLVEYFYREATKRHQQNGLGGEVQEGSFRYPGPKPQTKEAAILMVADAVESASRTLSEPTPARIEGLVTDMIDKRLHDGQFDECSLTLREIGEIRESLIKSLIAIYHARVKYPEQRTA